MYGIDFLLLCCPAFFCCSASWTSTSGGSLSCRRSCRRASWSSSEDTAGPASFRGTCRRTPSRLRSSALRYGDHRVAQAFSGLQPLSLLASPGSDRMRSFLHVSPACLFGKREQGKTRGNNNLVENTHLLNKVLSQCAIMFIWLPFIYIHMDSYVVVLKPITNTIHHMR